MREMVTQSIVPFMEGRVTTWNDQVASRRRGLSGRFMSLSKKWAGFGSGRGNKSSPVSSSSNSNYSSSLGFYTPDSPESVMHHLADYAFMLRDWKLSSTVYDILRVDFGDDKAWNHQAIANEMTAIALLLMPQSASTRPKVDAIDQMLDSASYTYVSRWSQPQNTVRCLVLAIELYRSRGGNAIEEAARWANTVLDLSILSPLAQRILTERLAICFKTKQGLGQMGWCSRKRKAAFWNLLAADVWLLSAKPFQAETRLQEAGNLYGVLQRSNVMPSFVGMQDYWEKIHNVVAKQLRAAAYNEPTAWSASSAEIVDEEREDLNDQTHLTKRNQHLSMGIQPPQSDVTEHFQRVRDSSDPDDGFS